MIYVSTFVTNLVIGCGKMKDLFFFVDDSGVLHNNEDYFVYAGYMFVGSEDKEVAKRKYRQLVSKIKQSNGITGELKACYLNRKQKRALYNVMRNYESFYVAVNNSNLYENIMQDKKSRHRFKDYALKRIIKEKIQYLIRNGIITSNEAIRIHICIDEQLTASNGYYSLDQSIREELCYGISNLDYGIYRPSVLTGTVDITVQFCDSSCNYLVQASDILANRIRASLVLNKPELRTKQKNTQLHLP